MSATQIAGKEASKASQKEKEEAAHAKKVAHKDKMWAIGAKDTTKSAEEQAKSAERAAKAVEKEAIRIAEGGAASSSGGAPVLKRCKDCKQMYNVNSKKGCQGCIDALFGGAAPAKGKKKK